MLVGGTRQREAFGYVHAFSVPLVECALDTPAIHYACRCLGKQRCAARVSSQRALIRQFTRKGEHATELNSMMLTGSMTIKTYPQAERLGGCAGSYLSWKLDEETSVAKRCRLDVRQCIRHYDVTVMRGIPT